MEGRKDDKGKLRYDLIPIEPMKEFAKVWGIGAEKYGDRNWESGILWSRIFSAIFRHLLAFWNGEQFDPEDGQEHLASVAWGAFVLMEYEKTKREFDDRQKIDDKHEEYAEHPEYPIVKLKEEFPRYEEWSY